MNTRSIFHSLYPQDKEKFVRRFFPTARDLLLKRCLRHLSLAHHENVLVIGAGEDPYRYLFAHAKKYICIDIEETPGVTDVIADAHALPFGRDQFDCVFSTEVMEHLRDPFVFIHEVNRVLRTEGEAVVTVPFLFHQHAQPYDYWRPTYHSLVSLFSDFSESEILSHGNRLHSLSDLITTSFAPRSVWQGVFFLLRIFNHALMMAPDSVLFTENKTTAPCGFLVAAKK